MSDSNEEFEDEGQDQAAPNPQRAHTRRVEAENKVLREQNAGLQVSARKLAFVEAGVDTTSKASSYFVKGYDGEMTSEAIRAAAVEANLITSGTDATSQVAEEAAWGRAENAARLGEKVSLAVDWNEKMSQTKNEAEVKALMAQYNAQQAKPI